MGSDSATSAYLLCVNLGLEYSLPSSVDERLVDTDEPGMVLDMGADDAIWFLKFWLARDSGCLCGSGVGRPEASSASFLIRFIMVGTKFDEMESSPASFT